MFRCLGMPLFVSFVCVGLTSANLANRATLFQGGQPNHDPSEAGYLFRMDTERTVSRPPDDQGELISSKVVIRSCRTWHAWVFQYFVTLVQKTRRKGEAKSLLQRSTEVCGNNAGALRAVCGRRKPPPHFTYITCDGKAYHALPSRFKRPFLFM